MVDTRVCVPFKHTGDASIHIPQQTAAPAVLACASWIKGTLKYK